MKETNMEHYRGEIEKAVSDKAMFGLSKKDGKIHRCHIIGCDKCAFIEKGLSCDVAMVKWLMSEYKPEPVLTEKEMGFVEIMTDGYIARDNDSILFWSDEKPYKKAESWETDFNSSIAEIDKTYFPFITWEDEEPWAVSDLRKLKVKGGVVDENSNM